jgi:integrase/recombinase XerD
MKNSIFLRQVFPKAHRRIETMPVFGCLTNDYLQWLDQLGYTRSSLRNHLDGLRQLSRWLQRRGMKCLAAVDQQILAKAHRFFLDHKPNIGGPIGAMQRYLHQRRGLREGQPAPPSPSEVELTRFAVYLREFRQLAEGTILAHQRRLRPFLSFIHRDQCPRAIQTLTLPQIEAFLKHAARTNNRFSMQHVVAALRAFLKSKHAQGMIVKPLHQQIDTPRVYRLERLPRALPWSQVQSLLAAIDQTVLGGHRDFTMLYLAAAYGLRSGELVRLTLDDIDWRGASLRVPQSKTRAYLRLPLTDEAAKVLIDYLRHGRGQSEHRELFLRQYAPRGPLEATAVNDVLDKWAGNIGLKAPRLGSHVLRHSFATHLMRRGVPIKTIGDTLGHRDPESTGIYLRLAIDDLRDVGLPVPACTTPPPRLQPNGWEVPRLRFRSSADWIRGKDFVSALRESLRSYLELKQALGRRFSHEAAILRTWDRFLNGHFPRTQSIRPKMFHQWAEGLGRLTPTIRRNHQRVVRNFILYHARSHPETFIPDPLTFPRPTPPRPPRLVSELEMGTVLELALRLGPSHFNPLRAQTVRLGFLLLYCCGLRRGELLRLKIRDFDPVERLLRIEGTKFYKSRLVPLTPSVVKEVTDYQTLRRKRKLPVFPESFLIWCGRRPDPNAGYTAAGLVSSWQHLCLSANVLDDRGRPPRLHDLRHSFATAALQRWYEQGVDVQTKMPHLAAYLGHVSPISTHHYLRLTPALRTAASERFQRRFGNLLNGGLT